MKKAGYIFFLLHVIVLGISNAQDISLFQQFNGRFDYLAIGNTMNIAENGQFNPCMIQTATSANLSLNTNQNVVAAYLYWAGSGEGDFEILLNDTNVTAERTFSDSLDAQRIFFAAFADVTDIVLTQGSGLYTISDFNLTEVIDPYCPTGTNFGGWAITIVYQDDSLPLNQLNVYDGLQSVPTFLSITLDNLNVLDNEDAKIGFVAWEGDSALAVNEQLTINGNIISNPPLNPANNAFNGTNSFTGTSDLYNMDIDVYNIQDNISIGDTSATITLTSGQDFVMINNVITVLNSQLPDATIVIDNFNTNCRENTLEVYYTVNNFNSTASLPANTPIAFYIDNTLIGQSQTLNTLAIGASENGSILLNIPNTTAPNQSLVAVVDDDGLMISTVTEINENNNEFQLNFELLIVPDIVVLPNLLNCNEGFGIATFNLFNGIDGLNLNTDNVSFYNALEDLENTINAIGVPSAYQNMENPEIIYVRHERPPCYEIFQFQLTTENCPPTIPDGFSPNNDTFNDWFNIQGLYNVFINHELEIYNRYGEMIFEGSNEQPWLGITNRGINNRGNLVPVGTYYYILRLNDGNYRPIVGWVYVNY